MISLTFSLLEAKHGHLPKIMAKLSYFGRKAVKKGSVIE
jgi:hypothetical protein